MIRTQDNHKPHSPTQSYIPSPFPAQVEQEGWCTYSILGAPLNRDLPLTVRPRIFPQEQA